MSFVFASSHLPELEHPADEEEEEDDVQPMPRSGMVRAFSHLPQPVRRDPAWPRPSAPLPASRPAWADAPDSPSGHAPADGHDPEPDDDADDGHGPGAETGPHEPDDSRPWYLPRITHGDLQPEGGGHDAPAKDNVGPVPRLSGGAGSFSSLPEHVEDDAANEHTDAGSHVDFAPPAPADGDNHGTIGPASPRGAAPAAGRSLFLTPRPMPPEYARQMATTYGAAPASPRSLADISGSTFQQVAAKTSAQQGALLSQSSPPARPANGTAPEPQQPTQGRGPTPSAQRGRGAAVPQNSGAGTAPQTAGSASSPETTHAGEKADDTGAVKKEALFQNNKTIDSSTIPKSQRGLAVLKEFFNPEARSIDELNDSMRKALAGDKALILHVNSNGGHSGIIAIHLDENGDLVNTLYDPAGSYKGTKNRKGSGDVLTNVLPTNGPQNVDWSLADYIKHHASDGSMSFVPIWTDGETARNLDYTPNTCGYFCGISSRDVIQQIPGFTKTWGFRPVTPNDLSDQLHRLMGRKVTIRHKP